jgi:thiopeptide-type bacteriocin biosynthesis protein
MSTICDETPVLCKQDGDPSGIADFAIVRVGGITAEYLGNLPLHKTAGLIERAMKIENDLRCWSANVEEKLYRLVPAVGDDTVLRRRILAMKRHVHNMRLWPDAEYDVATISVLLAEKDRGLVEKWYAKARERSALVSQAASSYEEELELAARALARGMQDDMMQQGLALASPDFLEQLRRREYRRGSKEWRPAAQLARTALAYDARAALKTSPLSTFTQLQVAGFFKPEGIDVTAGVEETPPLHRSVKLVRVVPLALLVLIARHRELARALQFAPNAGILKHSTNSSSSMILTNQYKRSGSYVWRTERMIERDYGYLETPEFLAFLESRLPRTYEDLIAAIPSSGRFADAHDAVIHLLDLQLIRPVAPYMRRNAHPLTALSTCLKALNTPLAQHVAEQLIATSTLVSTVGPANGADRLRILPQIRASIEAVYHTLGASAPSWLRDSKLVYEDVRYRGPSLELTEQVRQDLSELGRLIRPTFIRSHFYQYIYRHFVELFGPNGETADVLAFLNSFLQRPDISELFSLAISEDRVNTEDIDPSGSAPAVPPAGQGASPPASTIFFQIAARDRDAFERGDYKIILNQINAGQGGLLGRFAEVLDGNGKNVRDRLRSWTRELYAGSTPVEIPIFGDMSQLQSEQGIAEKTLEWPGEMPTLDAALREHSISIRDLRLKADEHTGTLSFTDAEGKVVSPTYLGVIPPHITPSAVALLLVIADPWICRYQMELAADRFGARPPCQQVEFSPRRGTGRIVLQRASWRFPANAVPLKNPGESDFDYFVRVQQWRAEYQLPDEVFVRAYQMSGSFSTDSRKPVWINFESPHSLEILRQLRVSGVESISLTEVLPSRNEHWFDQRVTEFMSLMRWPMPEPPAQDSVASDDVLATIHSPEDWICFHIYPPEFRLLDDVVQRVLPALLATAREVGNLERWFFLRYVDRRGWHIRLRLKGGLEARKRWRQAVGRLLDKVMSFEAPVKPGYTVEPYSPEYAKYGGPSGVVLAERLFDASSNFAIPVLTSVRHSETRRNALALHLMNATIDSFGLNEKRRQQLLRFYLWYWSGQDALGAAQKRMDAESRAENEIAAIDSELSQIANDDKTRTIVDEYCRQVRRAIEDQRLSGERLAIPLSRLCSLCLHLANNRLGIVPADEAYLAALLLTTHDGARVDPIFALRSE